MKILAFKIAAIASKLFFTLFGGQPSDNGNDVASEGFSGTQQKKPNKNVLVNSEGGEGKFVDEKGKVLSKQDMLEVLKSGQYIILKQKDKNNKLYYLVKKR